LQGTLKLWAGRPEQERLYEKGAQITIPVNTPYHWTVAGQDALRFVTTFEPAGEWEQLFESMSAIGRAASEKKLNPALAAFRVLNRRRDHMYFSLMPVALQKVLFATVAFIARLAGYPDDYPYR
jgi:hypothetical protein